MIVKVQRSLYPCGKMLVYDKKQLFTYEGPVTEEVLCLLGDDLKMYARCEACGLCPVNKPCECQRPFAGSVL